MHHHYLDHYSPDEYLPSIKEPLFHDLVHTLLAIEHLTVQLHKIRNPSFGYSVPQSEVLTQEKMQTQFFSLMKRVPTIESLYPNAHFSVFIQAFIDGVGIHLNQTVDSTSVNPDVLNDCIDHIHAYLSRSNIKRRAYLPIEKHRNHNKQISQFIDRLFDHHGRVLALRMDFSYRAGCFPTMTRIKRNRDTLIRYLRDQQPGFIGFIWRLEYGIDKGYHLHTVILLNANQVQRDIRIGQVIGTYWNKVITEGGGLHYNCNAYKSNYRDCGIGEIHWKDIDKRAIFERAALYLAKPDPLLEIARTLEIEYLTTEGHYELSKRIKNSRVFGLSQLDEIRGSRLGRPRCCS